MNRVDVKSQKATFEKSKLELYDKQRNALRAYYNAPMEDFELFGYVREPGFRHYWGRFDGEWIYKFNKKLSIGYEVCNTAQPNESGRDIKAFPSNLSSTSVVRSTPGGAMYALLRIPTELYEINQEIKKQDALRQQQEMGHKERISGDGSHKESFSSDINIR